MDRPQICFKKFTDLQAPVYIYVKWRLVTDKLGERNAILLSALPEAGVKGMDEVWVRCLWGEPWLVDLQVSWSVGGRGDHGGTPVPHSSSYLARLQ